MSNALPPPIPKIHTSPKQKGSGKSVFAKIGLGIIVVMIIGHFGSSITKIPEKTDDEKAAAAKSEWRWSVSRLIKAQILENLHDPDSVRWESIETDEFAKLVCVVYRAKNGFNALRKAVFILANGKTYTTEQAWNKYCSGKTLFVMPEL